MPVPFGFSIGDFLAVAELAFTVSRALSDSRGSESEYRALIELLNSVNISLRTVSSFLVTSSSTNGLPPPDPVLLDGLRTHLDSCQKLMKDFLESSKEYTESFGRAGLTRQKKVLGNWEIVKEWRKLKWRLFRAEDARVLEQRLKSHVSIFQLHMMAISFQSLARTQRAVTEGVGISRRLEGILSEVCQYIRDIPSKLPKFLGYSWEGSTSPKHSVVHFEDALGRHVELPRVLCRDYESFHDVLEIMFRKSSGHKRVLRKYYEIEDAEGNVINTKQWEQKVLPGVRIAMNIWMWSVSVFDMAVRFPRCAEDQPESTTIGDSSDLSQLCGDCKLVSKCWSIECMLQPQTCDPGSLAQMAHPIQSKAKCDEEHAFERSHCIRKTLYPLSGMTEREKLWIRRREYVWRLKDRLEALERQSLERERLERERIRMGRLHSEPY